MAGNDEGRTLQIIAAQGLAERLNRGLRLGADVGGVVVEGYFEVDVRLVLGDDRDRPALAGRQRPRIAVAKGLDEFSFRGAHGGIGGSRDREAAGERLLGSK